MYHPLQWPSRGGSAQGGVCQVGYLLVGCLLGGICHGGCLPGGVCQVGCIPPFVNRITDWCKNITFLQLPLWTVIKNYQAVRNFTSVTPCTVHARWDVLTRGEIEPKIPVFRFILRGLFCELITNNGLYCTKWVHSHLLFGQLLRGLKSLIMGYVPIFHNCVNRKIHAIVHA